MSRTIKGKKGIGYDYQGRRAGNKGGCNSPGNGVKRTTHRRERMAAKQDTRAEKEAVTTTFAFYSFGAQEVGVIQIVTKANETGVEQSISDLRLFRRIAEHLMRYRHD